MKRLGWILMVALAVGSAPVLAHGEKGPHGGQMLLVGTHRFEMVPGAGSFSVYVMDMKKNLLPLKGITGAATVHSDNDKKTDEVPLVVEGDHFVGKFDLKKLKEAEVHTKIKIDGKETTIAFEYPWSPE